MVLTLIEELHSLCEVVTPIRCVNAVVADPDDNMILECALVAEAEMIVSGDLHLLNLSCWEGIPILSLQLML